MNVNFSYESQNQSSYLVAEIPPSEKIVQYQLQMMTANDIRGLLSSMKRQNNESILIYYNITSRISLGQVLNRRKLTKKEFLNLLEGTAQAWKEIQEYQLEGDGLCFQEDYIFVKSDSCEPSFVYLPLFESGAGMDHLKEFIQRLILNGVVEMTTDNFIQVLLGTLNDGTFDIHNLEECLQSLKAVKQRPAAEKMKVSAPVREEAPAQPVRQQPEPQFTYARQDSPEKPVIPLAQEEKKSEKKAKKFGKLPKKESKREKETQTETPDEASDQEKNKKKFLLVQAVFMVCVAALISFGAFTDAETGALLTSNILAAVLIVGALEFVIYREIFVNSKKAGEKKKKEKQTKKPSAKKPQGRKIEIPGRKKEDDMPVPDTGRRIMPAAEVVPPRGRQIDEMPRQMGHPAGEIPNQAPPVVEPPRHAAFINPDMQPYGTLGETVMDDGDTDATDFWDPGQASDAFLEYMGEGGPTRIPLMKDSFLIGRLKAEVDFAVSNSKVGRIHAEILRSDGKYYIKDLNSKNGTYINSGTERISSNIPYPLCNGDRIFLANSEFVFHG